MTDPLPRHWGPAQSLSHTGTNTPVGQCVPGSICTKGARVALARYRQLLSCRNGGAEMLIGFVKYWKHILIWKWGQFETPLLHSITLYHLAFWRKWFLLKPIGRTSRYAYVDEVMVQLVPYAPFINQNDFLVITWISEEHKMHLSFCILSSLLEYHGLYVDGTLLINEFNIC